MYAQVRDILSDGRFNRDTRLVRLAGWRGTDADEAGRAGWLLSLAPAVCAVGAIGLGILGQPVLLGLLAATAAVGAVRSAHPVEELYNATLGRSGARIPKARAARAFGCLIGALMLTGAAIAYAAGAPTVGLVLAVALGGLAGFVAVTRVCVPSIVFTLLFGAERASQPTLARAFAPSR